MTMPLVLLHGVGLDHTVWDAVRTVLPGDLHAQAPDLLGHGQAPPAPPECRLADLAEHVAAALPSGPAHLVGFSLGAMVAQHLAVHRPDLVASIVCVSAVYGRSPRQREAVAARWRRAEQDFEAGVSATLQRWFPEDRDVPAETTDRTRQVMLANDRESYLRCYRVFATADQELARQVGRIRAPLLAVTGELDTGSTPDMSRRLAAAVPQGRAVVVPDVGHMLPEERPGELAHLITTFVKERQHA